MVGYGTEQLNTFVFSHNEYVFGKYFKTNSTIVRKLHACGGAMFAFALSNFDRNNERVEVLFPYDVKITFFQVKCNNVASSKNTSDNRCAFHIISDCIFKLWKVRFLIYLVKVDVVCCGYI